MKKLRYLDFLFLESLKTFVHWSISQETKIPTAGLYILGLGLELAAKLMKVDLLAAENKSMPGGLWSVRDGSLVKDTVGSNN